MRLLRERFKAAVDLLNGKHRLSAGRDHAPTCVVLALPDDPFKDIKQVEATIGKGVVRTRDLGAAIKAAAMDLGMPTQMIEEKTIDQARDEDLVSRKAWNLFTALYFKADETPGGPAGIPEGSCYIGASFFRRYDKAPKVQTSIVQAIDETGESLSLRGPNFSWDERVIREEPAPHDGEGRETHQ